MKNTRIQPGPEYIKYVPLCTFKLLLYVDQTLLVQTLCRSNSMWRIQEYNNTTWIYSTCTYKLLFYVDQTLSSLNSMWKIQE